MKTITIAAALLVACIGSANARTRGKLIEYGWDAPDTAYVREHIAEMEKIPFDGIVMRVDPIKGSSCDGTFGTHVFSKLKFKAEEWQHAIDDIKATKFGRFKDNFLQLTVYPGNVDWFDPEWPVAHTAGVLARIAKLSGCKGIMLDPEPYGTSLWQYSDFPEAWRKGHTFEEYRARVKECGKEFIREVNAEYPDITFLCLFGTGGPLTFKNDRGPIGEQFGLLRDFFDGVLEAAMTKTIIVDGYELSYSYRALKKFQLARDAILKDPKPLYSDARAFDRHVRVGFGVWADFNNKDWPFSFTKIEKNYFTPDGLRYSLANALSECDAYVWVYSENMRWWNPLNAPQGYIDALALAKIGPGPGQALPPVAAKTAGYSDEATFAEMRKKMTEVMDLPKDGWRWARDPANDGINRGWNRADCDDAKWRTISIGKFWEEQGEDYDGRAWYRIEFTAPAIDKGKRVYLAFGAADDSAWVWLNGEFVGKHDVGGEGWDRPFALDVTRLIKPGQANSLAVQVHDHTAGGGLWKSVKVMVR